MNTFFKILNCFAVLLALALLSACNSAQPSDTGDSQMTGVQGLEETPAASQTGEEDPGDQTGETVITPIGLLNTKGTDGDHAEDNFLTASLEIDFRSNVLLSSADTGYTRYDNAWYPRVKKVKDDLYLLLYHYGQYGQHIYYSTSSDGKNGMRRRCCIGQRIISLPIPTVRSQGRRIVITR